MLGWRPQPTAEALAPAAVSLEFFRQGNHGRPICKGEQIELRAVVVAKGGKVQALGNTEMCRVLRQEIHGAGFVRHVGGAQFAEAAAMVAQQRPEHIEMAQLAAGFRPEKNKATGKPMAGELIGDTTVFAKCRGGFGWLGENAHKQCSIKVKLIHS